MTFFKKIKLFIEYKKSLRKNKVQLESEFNIRIDRAFRLYTVLNIPKDLVSEPYNLRKSDIDGISDTYIREYIQSLSTYLNSIDLAELYDFYEAVKKVDKYSYLIIIGFKPFNSVRFNRWIYILLSIVIFLSTLLYFILR